MAKGGAFSVWVFEFELILFSLFLFNFSFSPHVALRLDTYACISVRLDQLYCFLDSYLSLFRYVEVPAG